MTESDYVPESLEHYERALKVMRTAETKAELDAILLLYIFDMSYPRADLLVAERAVRLEKGFR